MSLALIALGILVAVFATVMLHRAIVRPVQEALDVFERMARGDLTSRISSMSKNEIGRMMQALATMQESIAGIVPKFAAAPIRWRRPRSRSPPATRICRSVPRSRPHRSSRPRPAWKN
jgi:HAMP domain-containing protein